MTIDLRIVGAVILAALIAFLLPAKADAAFFSPLEGELFRQSNDIFDSKGFVLYRAQEPLAWGIYNPSDPSEQVFLSGHYTAPSFFKGAVFRPDDYRNFGIFATNGLYTVYSQSALNPLGEKHIFALDFGHNLLIAIKGGLGPDTVSFVGGCRNCEVAAVPVPKAALLFGSGLLCLGLIPRVRQVSLR